MTKSSLLSDEELYSLSDAQLYQLSINGKTKVLKKQINREMKRREKLVTGRKKKSDTFTTVH
jgi:hypothetical protein